MQKQESGGESYLTPTPALSQPPTPLPPFFLNGEAFRCDETLHSCIASANFHRQAQKSFSAERVPCIRSVCLPTLPHTSWPLRPSRNMLPNKICPVSDRSGWQLLCLTCSICEVVEEHARKKRYTDIAASSVPWSATSTTPFFMASIHCGLWTRLRMKLWTQPQLCSGSQCQTKSLQTQTDLMTQTPSCCSAYNNASNRS